MRGRSILIAGLLMAAGAGGLVLAQEDQAIERSAAPPPLEEAPIAPSPELANAVTPDEAPPPPLIETKPEPVLVPPPTPRAPVAPTANAVVGNNVEEVEPPPPPPPPPLKRPRFTTAILQAVDKGSAETLRFEAKVGQAIRYKGLTLMVHACETTAADEDFNDSAVHMEVQSQPQGVAGRVTPPPRQVFRGWMFAESPSLHPLGHPLYDVWLIACKTDAPPIVGASL